MDFAQNYRRASVPFTKTTASSVLEEFKSFYRWENVPDDRARTALDIGCGEGTVTMEVVKPFLPTSTRLDAADKSRDMLRLAKHCYEEQGYKFFLLDIEGEINDKSVLKSYDHVFTFFCFHFIVKPRKALQNMYNILKPNGNFLCVFMSSFPYFNAMKALSLNPKWASYMTDVDTMCPRLFTEIKFPEKILAEMMSKCGFRNIITKLDVKRVLFDSWGRIEAQARYADPFRDRIPIELQEEYFAAYFNMVKKTEGFITEKYNDNGEFEGVVQAWEFIIGYGEKGSQ